jgi:hypothetical protein
MSQQPLVGQVFLIIEATRSHTFQRTTLGRTLLEEWSDRRRYLLDNTQKSQQTDMFPTGFEPAVPASERPQIHALDSAATAVALKYVQDT